MKNNTFAPLTCSLGSFAGDVVDQKSKLNSLPNDVCKECRGLPIVITTIARALRNKRRRADWDDALRELRKPSPLNFTGLLEEEYSKIALSYYYLKGDELKKIFLIASLMVNNSSILDLLKYVMGLEILEGVNLTMEQARNRVDKLVGDLKDSCLLLDSSTNERFSMHDIVRIVALTIACKEEHVFTEGNDVGKEWTNKDELRKCTKISLASSKVISEQWPEGLDCPVLEFFYMNMMGSSFKIPENFFTGLPKSKVLNLSGLSLLPSSLGLLTNLQTLSLDNSNIQDVVVIGELKRLKILSLRHSAIKQLPEEIAKLTQLRLLDLSNCRELKIIAPNVISSLSKLEELYMSGCNVLWQVEGLGVERRSASLDELKHLRQLTTLEIDIRDDKILPKGLFSTNLERYKISIGHELSSYFPGYILGLHDDSMIIDSFMWNEHETLRTLRLKLNSFIWPAELQRFKNAEFLCLDRLNGIKDDLYELDKEGFSQLKHLHVLNNPNLLHIVDSTKCISVDSFPAFPILESLILFNLIKLEKICYGEPTTKSFYNLKFILVKSCAQLENIFSFSNASRSLPKLQRIKVKDCQNMKEIFAVEREYNVNNNEEIDHEIKFSQLRFLTLDSLKSLASFYSRLKTPPTLQTRQKELTINLQSNDTLMPLFSEKVIFPNLEALELKAIDSQMIWDSQLPPMSDCYQHLTRLIIKDFGKLKYVFPSSMVKKFKQLQHLVIRSCKELKEIVTKEGVEASPTFIFPQVVFPNLEALELKAINSQMMWDSQLPPMFECYRNLTHLIIKNSGKLKYVFPSSMVKNFKQLQHLEIRSCKELKEIVAKEGEEAPPTFIFPRIEFLKLGNLPELTTFYPGIHTSEWPKLKKLQVSSCDKLQMSTSQCKVAFLKLKDLPELIGLCLGLHISEWPMLKELQVSKCDKLQLTSDFKFNADWEELRLRGDNIMTWQCLFLEHFFFKGTIEIKGDKSTNFLLDILQRSIHIEKLILSKSLYKEIFSYGEKDKHKRTLMQIKSLKLSSLAKLKCVWKQDSKLDFVLQNLGVLEVYDCGRLISLLPSHASFANLTVLRVDRCLGLTNLFVPSTAKSLVQLMEMKIENCRMIVEIISNEDHEDLRVEDEIVFSKLKLLSLEDLESLTCFCFGNYNFQFPVLEELTVKNCSNMKTFSKATVSVRSLRNIKFEHDYNEEECWKGDLNTTIQHLHKKVVNSNFEKLALSGNDMMPVWQVPLPEHQFCQVKVLEVIRDESAHIPIEILQRFKNLEKLVLKLSSYQEIFSCGEDEKHVGMLTQLKALLLWGLFDLKYMWKQDSHVYSNLQNLEILQVCCCDNLINLLPSSASFENLTILKIWNCSGLINLVSSSTAKSLVRLKEMSIFQCEMMIQVVSNEGDKQNDEIVFEELKSLVFYDLESLTSFCSGNYSFRFPTLEKLVVDECSKMKTFSEGVLSTPSLQKVKQSWIDNEGYWEGDLNTTIQNQHKNLNIQIYGKDYSGQTSMKSPE
ncbi:uncharacterized protein LOC116132446 [Pistacia vera]|uniref:uncharacterized protein LOC116132446 n=1 Tax=Pistacia vera TaxID=55513 RepID=UPI0012633FE5|nr:uncharacterized protein LOC116132446 [Pistacia vera]